MSVGEEYEVSKHGCFGFVYFNFSCCEMLHFVQNDNIGVEYLLCHPESSEGFRIMFNSVPICVPNPQITFSQ